MIQIVRGQKLIFVKLFSYKCEIVKVYQKFFSESFSGLAAFFSSDFWWKSLLLHTWDCNRPVTLSEIIFGVVSSHVLHKMSPCRTFWKGVGPVRLSDKFSYSLKKIFEIWAIVYILNPFHDSHLHIFLLYYCLSLLLYRGLWYIYIG